MASTNFKQNNSIRGRDGSNGYPSRSDHAEAETAADTTEVPVGPGALRSGHQQHSMELIEGGRSATAPYDPLLTAEQVADRLNVSRDTVRSSRKNPPMGSKEVQPNATSNDVRTALPFLPEELPLTVRQAAAYLGVSMQTVYLWVERKQIPHLRVMGRNIRFLRSDLEPFRATFKQEVGDGKT